MSGGFSPLQASVNVLAVYHVAPSGGQKEKHISVLILSGFKILTFTKIKRYHFEANKCT